jgi:hypothetical protein
MLLTAGSLVRVRPGEPKFQRDGELGPREGHKGWIAAGELRRAAMKGDEHHCPPPPTARGTAKEQRGRASAPRGKGPRRANPNQAALRAAAAVASAAATAAAFGSSTIWSAHFRNMGRRRSSWVRPLRKRAMRAAVSGCRLVSGRRGSWGARRSKYRSSSACSTSVRMGFEFHPLRQYPL